MVSPRMEGWESRLNAVIEAARHQPYVLGEHDCFRLACRAQEALTGVDRWPEWAGQYSTKGEALRILARHGSTFEAAFDWFFGSAHVNHAMARRGDVMAFETADGQKHLGVCLGDRVACLIDTGLAFIAPEACSCAWRIG